MRPRDRADVMDDVPLPPLRPGLPYTPTERCQQLLLAIVAQAIRDDDEGTDVLIVGPAKRWFDRLLRMIGVDEETALQIKVAYCLGLLDPARFSEWQLNASRFETKAARSRGETISRWQSWPENG
jgi:hypothetical protein